MAEEMLLWGTRLLSVRLRGKQPGTKANGASDAEQVSLGLPSGTI